MKKKSLFLSAMITCVISLFTSCVQGDLYDLYDEDGLLIPRSKKSKDFNGGFNSIDLLYPYSSYPLLYQNTFYDWECGAQAYRNAKGCSNAEARVAIILQQYGSVDICSYNIYFYSVFSGDPDGNLPTGNDMLNGLNEDEPGTWVTLDAQPAIDYIYEKGRNSFLNRVPIVVSGSGVNGYRHVSTVTNVGIFTTNGIIKYTFYVTDQFGSSQYTILAYTTTNKIKKSDIIGFVLRKADE